jgi:hypothetical protein
MKYDFPNSPWWQYVGASVRLDEEYKIKKEALKAILKEAQAKCSHPETTYHTGSGNNDSYTECDCCGKEI